MVKIGIAPEPCSAELLFGAGYEFWEVSVGTRLDKELTSFLRIQRRVKKTKIAIITTIAVTTSITSFNLRQRHV